MAVLKIVNHCGKYHDENARATLERYIKDIWKTDPLFIDGLAVNPKYAAEEMSKLAEVAGKTSGIQLRHFILSLAPREARDPIFVLSLARAVAEYYADEYQILFAVHCDHHYLHAHFMMNAVSYKTGLKYPGTKDDYYAFKRHVVHVLKSYGITSFLRVETHRYDDSQMTELQAETGVSIA